jgi:hypothetical protein
LSTSDDTFVVVGVHEKASKVDVVPADADVTAKPKTVDAAAPKKVTVHNAEAGSFWLRDKASGKLYEYAGQGRLSPFKFPAVLEQKWDEERKASEQRLKQEREQKEAKKKEREAEAAKRAIDKIAKAKERKSAKAKRSRKKTASASDAQSGETQPANSADLTQMTIATMPESNGFYAVFDKTSKFPNMPWNVLHPSSDKVYARCSNRQDTEAEIAKLARKHTVQP